jgi:hypothetical protein
VAAPSLSSRSVAMELHWLKPEGSATGSCQISPGFGMGARPLREQPWIVSEPVAAIEARAKCHNFCEKMSRCLQPSSTAAAGSRCHAAPVRTSIFATGFAIRPARCRDDFKPPASAIATSDGPVIEFACPLRLQNRCSSCSRAVVSIFWTSALNCRFACSRS